MNRILLLATVSLVALAAGSACAGWQTPILAVKGKALPLRLSAAWNVLYRQNRKDEGVGVVSGNFTCGSYSPTYNAQGADDFIIPAGQTWIVREVDATGQYFNGYGPTNGESVYFYHEGHGKPGRQRAAFPNLVGTDTNGDFAITLPGKGIRLRAGHYWVSVVTNVDFVDGGGEWGWELTKRQHNDPAMWQNPADGFGTGCTTWNTLDNCVGSSGDFMFALRGVVTSRDMK